MHHSNEQALTVIMMLVFSRCTVAFNNYSTLYMVHSIPTEAYMRHYLLLKSVRNRLFSGENVRNNLI